ncbi:Zinc finger protein [Paramyrothecium foliicola]|nr:Zinc finger protein [Paramyrothecium foliicola]
MSSNQAIIADVHDWLSEPGGYSYPLGIVGSFYHAIFDLFSNLLKECCASSSPIYSSLDTIKRYKDELRRLYLWGEGFSVEEGHLDEILTRSSELRHNVLSLFLQLSRVLSSEIRRVVSLQEEGQQQSSTPGLTDLVRIQEQVTLFLQTSESLQMNLFPDSDAASEFQASDTGEDIIDDISTYIDCLMDLSQAIEHPAMGLFDDQEESSQHDIEVFDVATPQALMYCRKIRDRFPKLDKYMVERLGTLNADRAFQISSAQLMHNQILEMSEIPEILDENCENRTVTDPPSESLFSNTNPHLTDTTKSTTKQSSSFSASISSIADLNRQSTAPDISGSLERSKSHSKRVETVPGFDDTESIVTFASYSTTASAAMEGRPRVPPLPEGADTSGTFDCPACWRELRGPMSRDQWKQHIYDDLVPYCCLYERCSAASETFQRTRGWANHLQSHAKSDEWPLPTCPFCGPESRHLAYDTFLKHVSNHFREVALAALPPSNEESEYEDNADSSSLDDGSLYFMKDLLQRTTLGNENETHYNPIYVPSLENPPATVPPLFIIPTSESTMGHFGSKVSSSTQKKYKCKVCDKRFTRPSFLQTHLYSHTGEKPFACEVEGCGRQFSIISNLRRHRKVHRGDAHSEARSKDRYSD